jgi:hypothetical protein
MSTISAGTTSGTALVNTGDTTGALVFKTNTNTTALTLDVSGNATFPGNVTVTGPLSGRENVQVIGTNTNAVAATVYVITADLTLTLPASPTAGDWVGFSNRSGVTTVIIARNGSNIMSLAENMTLDTTQARGVLIYADATRGWTLLND